MTTTSARAAGLEGPWQQVMIAKRSETGRIERDVNGNVIERARLLDTRTGKFYRTVPTGVLCAQIALLPVALPAWTLGQMTWSAGRCFIDVPRIVYQAFQQLAADWQKGVKEERLVSDFIKRVARDIDDRIGTNVRHFISAPFFAARMADAALRALSVPWEVRKNMGDVERVWQEKASFKEDVRWQGINGKAFYLYWCFQPRGNINKGPHFVSRWSWEPVNRSSKSNNK